MSEESVVAADPVVVTADEAPSKSLSILDAAAELKRIREAPEASVEEVAEEAETPEPVEAVKETAEAEEADFEPDWSELADTSDDIEASDEASGPVLTLKRKGEERQVTKDEATRLAQMGLDYDTRMNEFHAERRQFEETQAQAKETYEREISEARTAREALAERLSKFTNELKPPTLELAETDLDEYHLQMARYNAANMEAEQAAKELDSQNRAEHEKRQARTNAALEAHMNRLNQRVPATKEQATMDKVGKYMVEGMGFTRDDLVINQRVHPADSRLLEMAFKAMKYDEARLKAKKMRAKPGKTTASGNAGRASAPPV